MATESIRRIWLIVSKIPSGKVASYGQVADLAGLPGRARLTARALKVAPKELALPWYRVLRSSGEIAFAKGSDDAKRQAGLLQEENVVVLNNRVKLKSFGWEPSLEELMLLPF